MALLPYANTTSASSVYTPATRVIAPVGYSNKANYYTDGTADDVEINNALTDVNNAGGGTVLLVPGYSYTISQRLIIYSNTTLIAYGATINWSNGASAGLMLQDAYQSGLASSVDHISVRGGKWSPGTITALVKGMILGGARLDVRDLEFTSVNGGGSASGFSLQIHNATDFVVENIFFNGTVSDGLHLSGPVSRGMIKNIWGTTGDDLIALLPNEWTPFSLAGDITDIAIDTVIGNNSTTRLVDIVSGSSGTTIYNTKRIKVRNVFGTMVDNVGRLVAGIYIGDDASNANTTLGVMDDISIDNVNIIMPDNTKPIINFTRTNASPVFNNLRISNVQVSSDCESVIHIGNAKVTNFVVNNISGATSTVPPSGVIYIPASSTVVNMMVDNVELKFAGARTGQLINLSASGSVINNIYLNNCVVNNAAQLFDTAATGATTNFYLSNIRLISNGAICNIRTGTTVVIQACNGLHADTTTVSITATGTLESKSPMFPLDITNAQIVASQGDMAYNTNSSASTDIGPVVYRNSTWVPMAVMPDYTSIFMNMGA